jgi:hypothetical protein
MKLGTHMPDGERRKPIDIEVCRSKVKVTTSKNRTKISELRTYGWTMPSYTIPKITAKSEIPEVP